MQSPWAQHAEKTPADADASKTQLDSMRELMPDGSAREPAQILKEAGYEVGGLVQRKADRTEFKILAVKKGAFSCRISFKAIYYRALKLKVNPKP